MERPILFTGAMVRAILDGTKTQTRRVVNPQPDGAWAAPGRTSGPYGWIGDLLYVRETWRVAKALDGVSPKMVEVALGGDTAYCIQYRAGDVPSPFAPVPEDMCGKWRPSIHMPKSFSRLWLRVTDVRVERLQEISETDCLAEGVTGLGCDHMAMEATGAGMNCTDCYNSGWIEPPGLHFLDLWNSINAKRGYSWDSDPYVRAVTFERT